MRHPLLFSGLLAALWISVNSTKHTAVVQTTYGPIKGEEITLEGTHYKSFKGIPYAAPPVGVLRFAAPQPPQKWTKARDATSYGNICPQSNDSDSRPMSEDCLTLNVFTKSLENKSLKPVLFWIHGGAFVYGDGTDMFFGPEYLIGEDIVIVTINYRLGPLGFLSTNTAEVSGNWGLKDQVAALKWVQENIAHFGGDPKQVTIYGESSGATSTHLHLLSPLSKGLFSKAIAASGAATMSSTVKPAKDIANYSNTLALALGGADVYIKDPVKRIEYLRKADVHAIVELGSEVANEEDLKNPIFDPACFVPVIEAPGTRDAFLTEEPRKLLEEGKFTKVPLMMGMNDLEGGVVLAGSDLTTEVMKNVEEDICRVLPGYLKEAVMAKNECQKVAKEISDTYFAGKPFDSSLLNFINLCGDLIITIPVHLAQVLHARVSNQNPPIYNYYFTFDGEWNFMKLIQNISLPGASHADDLFYVFKSKIPLSDEAEAPLEAMTKNRMVRLIANFVKYGNPTPAVSDLIPVKWEPASVKEHNTMVIGNELKLENEFLKARMDMWDKLFKEYTGKVLFS